MRLTKQEGDYYSNCLIEMLKAKIKWGKQIKIIVIPPQKNKVFPHFMWHDLMDNNIYDFHNVKRENGWWHSFLFLGYIRVRPYFVYEKWLKTKEW